MSAVIQPTLYRGHLIVENDVRLDTLIPHAKKTQIDGRTFTLVPHKLDEYRVLRNLSYDIQPPIMSEYTWPIVDGNAPFESQKLTAALITVNDRCYVLNDLGTGKTRAALMAFDYLRKEGAATKLLVAAPLSTLRPTWAAEVMKTFNDMKVVVIYGTADKRRKLLAQDADVYVINHDGLEIVLDELIARTDIDMVVYDELTAIKTKTIDRWKVANRLFEAKKRVVGMTGRPTPEAPTDAYGQIKALTPHKLDNYSFSRFRDYTMNKITQFKWVPRHDAMDRVYGLMQPSIRFTRDQCIDLPPCQTVDYQCTLSPEQRKLFNTLRDEFAAQLANGTITTANAADRANKMLQVVLGCVYKEDGSVEYLDAGPRLRMLDDIIAQAQGKVIIFTPYVHSLQMLKDHLQKYTTVETVYGGTQVSERNRIFARFQQTPDPRVLAAHPQCMSHGLTLTEASVIVWWGLPPSVEIYDQANARITRPGQKLHQFIARIIATSMETSRYRSNEKKLNDSDEFLNLIKHQQLTEVL